MKKELKRDGESKVVAGVLSGLADYFDQDPVLFRLLAITFLIFTGIFPSLLMYIVAWVIMPESQKVEYKVIE